MRDEVKQVVNKIYYSSFLTLLLSMIEEQLILYYNYITENSASRKLRKISFVN